MAKKKSITIKITDNLSGIGSYRATIDGEWVLMTYDAKNDLLKYNFDDKITIGNHTFRLTVKDKVGNKSLFVADFNR